MVLGPEFQRILQAAKSGAEWAWAAIYRDLAGPVKGYYAARGVTEAEDLAGETFLHVFRDIASFEGEEKSFRSWVFVIAHRRLVDHYRAATKRSQLSECVETTPDVEGGNTEDDALQRLSTGEVLSALRRLTEDQRTVLALRVFGGLSAEQIAAVVGRRAGAVRATQYRGLLALRQILEDRE